MISKELKTTIKKGESETVEFKESFDKEAIETAGAFANTSGGVILIGITRKGLIKGCVANGDILKDWANQISQSTEPRIIPEIAIDNLDGKDIVIINIKDFPIKPVSVKGKHFIRVNASNRAMTSREIADMHIHSTGSSWDKLVARDAKISDIDIEQVKKHIHMANESGRRKIKGNESPLSVLEKWGLIKSGKPTWAAILLFGKEQRTIAQLHCGRFKEETLVIDDRMICEPLADEIDEAMDFIRKNINVKFVITGKPRRDDVWDYPLDALREALTNAICHRDYTHPSNAEVRIHDDRLSIWNPGKLPFGMTIEKLYKPHESILRNHGIGQVFFETGKIEQWGSGIEKIRKLCVAAGLPEPSFEEHQDGFLVTFRKDIYTEEHLRKLGLNDRQIKAVMYVKERNEISNKDYQEMNTVSERTATRDLKDLLSFGVFKLIGTTGKGTKYVLKSKAAIKPPKAP